MENHTEKTSSNQSKSNNTKDTKNDNSSEEVKQSNDMLGDEKTKHNVEKSKEKGTAKGKADFENPDDDPA